MMRKLDLPPLWLLACIVLAWAQARYLSMGLDFGGAWAGFVGGLLVGGGILMMLLAVYEMRSKRTTFVPHRTRTALVQSGIFSRTRNPIYLGDALALALIPIFVWIIERRFIIPEENRMRREFRADFARYEAKTRRWV